MFTNVYNTIESEHVNLKKGEGSWQTEESLVCLRTHRHYQFIKHIQIIIQEPNSVNLSNTR